MLGCRPVPRQLLGSQPIYLIFLFSLIFIHPNIIILIIIKQSDIQTMSLNHLNKANQVNLYSNISNIPNEYCKVLIIQTKLNKVFKLSNELFIFLILKKLKLRDILELVISFKMSLTSKGYGRR